MKTTRLSPPHCLCTVVEPVYIPVPPVSILDLYSGEAVESSPTEYFWSQTGVLCTHRGEEMSTPRRNQSPSASRENQSEITRNEWEILIWIISSFWATGRRWYPVIAPHFIKWIRRNNRIIRALYHFTFMNCDLISKSHDHKLKNMIFCNSAGGRLVSFYEVRSSQIQ